MHKILLRWKDAGFKTAEDVKNGDRKPGAPAKNNDRKPDSDEQAAILRMLQEG